jgi:hypothetical protein
MRIAIGLLLLTCLGASGCAVQGTGGLEWAGKRGSVVGFTATGTLQALRKSNSVVGLRVNTVASHGYSIRSVMLHGGYDWLTQSAPLAFELGVDLGAGSSVQPLFDGVGAYGGVSSTLRFRPWPWTVEPSYNLLFPMVEVVLVPRVGFWMPPEGGNTTTLYAEGGAEIGLRFAIGSDLATSGQGQVWDGGPQCGNHAPGGHGDVPCQEENP